METFIPKNPETLTEFKDMLAEYNEIMGFTLNFTQEYNRNIDVWCTEESTVDGYSVWAIYQNGERPELSENVYYNQPDAYDLFNFINDIYFGKDEMTIYCDIEQYELEEYIMGELHTNYDNYLQNIEDEK
jgi:hypothetical protein